jgi:hypothetical protein
VLLRAVEEPVKVSKGIAELVRFVRETTTGSGARARPEDQRFLSAEFLVLAVLQDLQDDLVAPLFLDVDRANDNQLLSRAGPELDHKYCTRWHGPHSRSFTESLTSSLRSSF